MSKRAPAMYISHGSPMFALQPGKAGEQLRQITPHFDNVKAVLIISPHWMGNGLAVTSAERLDTIHDFYGFPPPCYTRSNTVHQAAE